jgi:hypothetical protein
MNRRLAITISAATIAAATIPWLRSTRLGDAVSAAEEPQISAVQTAAIRALLALDHPRAPALSAAALSARMDGLYHLNEDPIFVGALTVLNSVAAFSDPPALLLLAERATGRSQAEIETALDRDRARLREWQTRNGSPAHAFTELKLEHARGYLDLWLDSGLGVRRRFFRSLTSLVMATAYTTDEYWHAIEYEGPYLSRPR